MLKRYAEPERIRWTGKAWEIKNAIRVLERQKRRERPPERRTAGDDAPASRLESTRKR
ncbi:hypothetical protein OMP38_01900 [Cohnella ginsengisoli]|uniref:Z-ring formation inhibitor MciZ n=1 Tax=Cohnella ginsengisoli TaxID=425004 RepID=A0A9X4KDE1_9BACL|nr:hypothetical protein [Cohnella ginsengisoli]MDG0789736.1 hypothetical protein [Cohnella ginsengisoli]